MVWQKFTNDVKSFNEKLYFPSIFYIYFVYSLEFSGGRYGRPPSLPTLEFRKITSWCITQSTLYPQTAGRSLLLNVLPSSLERQCLLYHYGCQYQVNKVVTPGHWDYNISILQSFQPPLPLLQYDLLCNNALIDSNVSDGPPPLPPHWAWSCQQLSGYVISLAPGSIS